MPRTRPSRRPNLARRVARGFFRAVAAIGLLAWFIGWLFSDRVVPTQFLSFVPAVVLLPAVAAALLLARIAAAPRSDRGHRHAGQPRHVSGSVRRRVSMTTALMLAAFFVVMVDWRWWSIVRPGAGPSPGEPTFRVLLYNPATRVEPSVADRFVPLDSDLIALINPWAIPDLTSFVMTASPASVRDAKQPDPDDSPALSPAFSRAHLMRRDRFAVLSRHPIIASGFVSLELNAVRPSGSGLVPFSMASDAEEDVDDPSRAPSSGQTYLTHDDGSALYVQLSAPAMGPPWVRSASEPSGPPDTRLTVWIVDLPSNPSLHRVEAVRRLLECTASFPRPDVVLGDFNTPRGASSLRLFARRVFPPEAGRLRNAYHDAGIGPDATWPRRFPVLHIDQAFLAPHLRATSHRTVNPGTGSHLALFVEVTRRGPSAGQ